MSNKVYVVSRIGYEYNDETYYRGEDGGVHPIMAYTSEGLAKNACLEKTLNAIKNDQYFRLGNYGYDIDDVLKSEHNSYSERSLWAADIDLEEVWENGVKGLTDSQICILLDNINVAFFEVVEVYLT